jgi:hypothetical protein
LEELFYSLSLLLLLVLVGSFEEGVNEGAGRRLGVPTDGNLACVLF